MADDINIEEHDVMDNPQLNDMLPVITNIKSEVMDYDDENEYQEYMDPNKVIKTEPFEYETNPIINSNVIIFGTKPSTPIPHPTASTSISKNSSTNRISFESDYDEDDDDYSDVTDEDPQIIPCSVVLEDWQSLLMNNSCYCSECEILFPTTNTIEAHRMTAHSFLVPVSNNKAVKSTSKSSVDFVVLGRNKALKSTSKNTKDYNQVNSPRIPNLLCQHCNSYFPSKNDLIVHLNSLLPGAEESCEEEEPMQADCETEVSDIESYVMCTICSAYYKHEENFLSHILLHHGSRHLKQVNKPFHPYCKFCKIFIYNPKKYNCHIRVRHPERYFFNSNNKNGHHMCHICKGSFPSAQAEWKHRLKEHETNIKSFNLTLKRTLMRDKGVNSIHTKKVPGSIYATRKVALKPIKINKSKTVKNENRTTVAVKNEAADSFDDGQLVPKSQIFKCAKCPIHFISATTAWEHTKQCTLSRADWQCKCKRRFLTADRQLHIQQHKLTARFKAITISEHVLARALNRCRKCNVCFDDATFSKYHASGCKPCPSLKCSVCNLYIHKLALASHSRTHTELGLKRSDFIIVNYCNISKLPQVPIKVENDESVSNCDEGSEVSQAPGSTPGHNISYNKSYNKVYYCPNCKLYLSINKPEGHVTGECVMRNCGRELCKLCGLSFSRKGIITHKLYHKKFNIKLHNLSFTNIIDGKRIRPPFPEFMLCPTCRVHFVSRVALQNHACYAEEHKSCPFCHKTYSDLALKLHVAFHRLANSARASKPLAPKISSNCTVVGERKPSASTGGKNEARMPTPIHDLIKKYESLVTVWNILYRCRTCDIVYDSYDAAVEHCQDHFSKMDNYNLDIKYCKLCDLKFVGECHGRHERLHSQNDVSAESFVIIDCDYSLLLSDRWQKVLDSLSGDQQQQVLSKSIYNEIRGVRMALQSDGDLGTVYKCSLCNVAVDLESVVEHVRRRQCSADDAGFACAACAVTFSRQRTATQHAQRHELSDAPYRIVRFNDPKYLFIDEALIRSAKAEDLKFIRCQYCGKLINKGLYRMHIYKHNYTIKAKLLRGRQVKCSDSVVPSVKGKVSKNLLNKIDQKSMYRYYVCVKCNVALFKYSGHVCRDANAKKKCPKCQVFISAKSSDLWRHNSIHKKIPALSHRTIKLTYFNPNEKKKNVQKITKPKPLGAPVEISEKLRYFSCVHCKKCVTQKSLRSHQCNKGKTGKCDLCGIILDGCKLPIHRGMHDRIAFTEKDVIVIPFDYKTGDFPRPVESRVAIARGLKEPETDADTERKPDYLRVYKCTECELFFFCRGNLVQHLLGERGACDVEAGERCDRCNLNFHSSEMKQHKAVQFCRSRKVSMINVCTLLLRNADPNDESNWLFYCKRCDIYNSSTLKHHFDSQHRMGAAAVRCPTCNVRFVNGCLGKHRRLHHGAVEIPLADINVEIMEDCSLEEAGYVSSARGDTLDVTRDSGAETSQSMKVKIKKVKVKVEKPSSVTDDKIPNVFKCSKCNLHFLHRTSYHSHVMRKEHNAAKIPCKICGMPFSRVTVNKHAKMHRFASTFNVIDPLERSEPLQWIDKGRISVCDSSMNTSDAPDPAPTAGDDAVSDDRREEITSNSKKTAEINTENAYSSATSSNEISSTNPVCPAKATSEVKLFKCGPCDVYFLTAECCSSHATDHAPLDATEYIACKICDLQFLNQSLDGHMRGHREKTFNMDTLVVDEYQPDGPNVKIDTYSAIDRLKSKLVSTTTESD